MKPTMNEQENTAKTMQDATQAAQEAQLTQPDAAPKTQQPEAPEGRKYRSEFAAEVNAVARRLSDLALKDTKNRAFVLLAVDSTPVEDADDDTYQSIRAETGLGENITLCLQSYGSNKRALLAFTNAMLCAAQELKEKAADSSRNAPCENPS